MSRIFKLISSIFLLAILIQILPSLVANIKEEYSSFLENSIDIGKIKIDSCIDDIDENIKSFRSFFENKNIKAILLHIESQGGVSGPSQALFKEIKSLKQEYPKPIVVLTTSVCASGAYYVASASDYIVASPSALIGGIGSYVSFFKLKEFIENLKIKYDVKKSGDLKTAGNPFTDMTPEMDAMLQSLSDNIYKQFTKDIAIARRLSLKDTDKWANGIIFTGEQALALKLVDEVGSEFNAIKKIRELALIEKEQKINWVNANKTGVIQKISNNFVSSIYNKAIESSSRLIAIS